MSTVRPSLCCERVRRQISLGLDGELSRFERKMLSAHLRECGDCQAYQEDVTKFTHALRWAPLERMEQPVLVRRPSRQVAFRIPSGFAAALAILLIAVAGLTNTGRPSEPAATMRFPSTADLVREQEQALGGSSRDGAALGRQTAA